MKRLINCCVVALCVVFLTACQKESKANMTANMPKESTQNEKTTVTKVDFEEVSDSNKLPPNMENSVNILKANKGFFVYDYNGFYYVAIFSGKKNTGGYDIKALSIEDNSGKALITVEEIEPMPGAIVTQVITYPYTIIKVCGITADIVVKNIKGEMFERLMKQGEMH
jgi:nitrogen regulatory protein PII-like uncharacterized protein